MQSQSEAFLYTIGDVGVSRHWIVTPNGTAPLRGSQWIVTDFSRVEQKIPTYAIVLAIVFAIFCLLGLLFLLIKEPFVSGYVHVDVQSEDLHHTTQVPVFAVEQVSEARATVGYIQSMAATA